MIETLPGKKIHFVGTKGAGMAPLAKLLKEMGYEVSGSDKLEQFPTDKILADAKIIATEFDVHNLENKPDLVVISAAYSKENPEVKEAYKKRLAVKPYSEVLGIISKNYQTIAVAGIHGKTTTAALISFLLKKANFDPTYLIGAGEIFPLGSSAHAGKGDYFVVEADEYRKSFEDPSPKFLDLSPQIEIITSIEMDHPDIYLSEEDIYHAFYKFACHLPRNGFIVLNTDYPKAKKLQRSLVDREIVSYGLEKASFQIINLTENPTETTFMLAHKGENLGPFRLAIPGLANVLNATAAIITCRHLEIEEKIIKKYLCQFLGVKRRFEKIGQIDEIFIYDDYAHHPRAIKMTLEAARQKFPLFKIIAIFQSHTYSRTKALLSDFAQSFKNSDKVIITDIYSSREKEKTISGFELSQEVKRHQRSVKYIAEKEKIVQEILDTASGKTLIITIGAGDVYKIALEIFESLKNEKSQNN
ncbi:MAG: UDP-N-acetylmuramate--L-alanine ligase [Patescibacteria group bacterium]